MPGFLDPHAKHSLPQCQPHAVLDLLYRPAYSQQPNATTRDESGQRARNGPPSTPSPASGRRGISEPHPPRRLGWETLPNRRMARCAIAYIRALLRHSSNLIATVISPAVIGSGNCCRYRPLSNTMRYLLGLVLCAAAAWAAPSTILPRYTTWICRSDECPNYFFQGTDTCYFYCRDGTCDVRGQDCVSGSPCGTTPSNHRYRPKTDRNDPGSFSKLAARLIAAIIA